MPTHRILSTFGAAAFMIVGAGHLLTHALAPSTPERQAIVQAMKGYAVRLPGRAGTLFEYHEGFSLTMGVLLIAFGALSLIVLRQSAARPAELRGTLLLQTVVAGICAALSARYFFAVPLFLTTLAALAFGLAALRVWRMGR